MDRKRTLPWLGALLGLLLPLQSARTDPPALPDDPAAASEGCKDGKEGEKEEKEEKKEPGDLTLWNLFSAGWNEEFKERSKAGRAPRIRLFRTRQAFLEREFRLNYRFENNGDGGEVDEHELEPEVELPWNRRFMTEIEGEYVWQDLKNGEPDRDGSVWAVIGMLQLVDTYNSAMNVQLRLEVPSKGELDEGRTNLGLVLAGFRDLGNQYGLQAHIEKDFLIGDHNSEDPHHVLTYALALQKTLTDDVKGFEHFTVFVEAYGVTDLDDEHDGSTRFSFLPGVRWEVGKEWWVAAGIELPVSGPRPFDGVFHFAIIKDID